MAFLPRLAAGSRPLRWCLRRLGLSDAGPPAARIVARAVAFDFTDDFSAEVGQIWAHQRASQDAGEIGDTNVSEGSFYRCYSWMFACGEMSLCLCCCFGSRFLQLHFNCI